MRGHTETCYFRSFPKHVNIWHESKWRHQITEATMLQVDILSNQVKKYMSRMSCILLSHWPMEPPKHQQFLPRLCYPQLDGKVLLLKTTLTYVIKHGEVRLVPNQKLHPYGLSFLILEGTLYVHHQSRKIISPTYKPCGLQQQPPCKTRHTGAIMTQILCE